jgi:hypothetical protein
MAGAGPATAAAVKIEVDPAKLQAIRDGLWMVERRRHGWDGKSRGRCVGKTGRSGDSNAGVPQHTLTRTCADNGWFVFCAAIIRPSLAWSSRARHSWTECRAVRTPPAGHLLREAGWPPAAPTADEGVLRFDFSDAMAKADASRTVARMCERRLTITSIGRWSWRSSRSARLASR